MARHLAAGQLRLGLTLLSLIALASVAWAQETDSSIVINLPRPVERGVVTRQLPFEPDLDSAPLLDSSCAELPKNYDFSLRKRPGNVHIWEISVEPTTKSAFAEPSEPIATFLVESPSTFKFAWLAAAKLSEHAEQLRNCAIYFPSEAGKNSVAFREPILLTKEVTLALGENEWEMPVEPGTSPASKCLKLSLSLALEQETISATASCARPGKLTWNGVVFEMRLRAKKDRVIVSIAPKYATHSGETVELSKEKLIEMKEKLSRSRRELEVRVKTLEVAARQYSHVAEQLSQSPGGESGDAMNRRVMAAKASQDRARVAVERLQLAVRRFAAIDVRLAGLPQAFKFVEDHEAGIPARFEITTDNGRNAVARTRKTGEE